MCNLIYASKIGNVQEVKILLQGGDDVNFKD